MSGQTGKMTREAIRARGPRTALVRICTNLGRYLLICREDQRPFIKDEYVNWMKADWYYVIVAKSYTLKYLLRIAGASK
jgi:hypothetical protein